MPTKVYKQSFTNVPFGPLPPLDPSGTPREQRIGPRRFQYTAGDNIITQPRSDVPSGISFSQLRALADNYDAARIAIEVRKDEVLNQDWVISPKRKGESQKYRDEIDKVTKFLRKPDGEMTFDRWLNQVLEEILVTDALTLYAHPTRGDSRKLAALEVVDGATIKPLIDSRGKTPFPPLPAYQQAIYGLPRTEWTTDEMYYRPKNRRVNTVYGFPPTEWIIMRTMIGLRKQTFDLNWYAEGNTPEGLYGLDDENWTAEQIMEFEVGFNQLLEGNSEARSRMKFLPKGEYVMTRQFTFDPTFDEFLLKVTCAAYGIPPNEIGFTTHVNRATGDVQENVMTRRGIAPLCRFVGNVLTEIIHEWFGYTELFFTFNYGMEEDDERKAQADSLYVKMGKLGVDELRDRDAEVPLGIPPYIVAGNNVIWLTDQLKSDLEKTGYPQPPIPMEPAATSPDGGNIPRSKQPSTATPTPQPDKPTIKPTANSRTLKKVVTNGIRELRKKVRDFEADDLSDGERSAVLTVLDEAVDMEKIASVFEGV